MRKIFTTILFGIISAFCISQTTQDNIEQTNLDSLVKTVREISGEDSLYINNVKTIIKERVTISSKNLFLEYAVNKFNRYNLDVLVQKYDSGKNIIAKQKGNLYPDSIYIVCAHYDAVTTYCADDDGSGVAAVLEAARILSNQCNDYSIWYILFDEEERGKVGSNFFVDNINISKEFILGTVNMEMLGYDSDDDGKFDIHINNNPNSIKLKNTILNVIENHSINLKPIIYLPGTSSSDHGPFWYKGYGALVYSEAYYGGDFNPNYHINTDRIDQFNLSYFHKMAQVGVGTISSLAKSCQQTALISEITIQDISVSPNPFQKKINIKHDFESELEIELINYAGQKIFYQKSLSKDTILDLENLEIGLYYMNIKSGSTFEHLKIIKK